MSTFSEDGEWKNSLLSSRRVWQDSKFLRCASMLDEGSGSPPEVCAGVAATVSDLDAGPVFQNPSPPHPCSATPFFESLEGRQSMVARPERPRSRNIPPRFVPPSPSPTHTYPPPPPKKKKRTLSPLQNEEQQKKFSSGIPCAHTLKEKQPIRQGEGESERQRWRFLSRVGEEVNDDEEEKHFLHLVEAEARTRVDGSHGIDRRTLAFGREKAGGFDEDAC